MKHINVSRHRAFFKPLLASDQVQSAVMVLKPGQSSSEAKETEHPRAEQWCFVVSGSGKVKVTGRSIKVRAGSLVLVQKNERHQITNSGSEPLVTVNFYAPPAYTKSGDVKPSVER